MSDKSKIEWTDATWNPVTGCSKVTPGCSNCYAERMAKRLRAAGAAKYADGFALQLHPDELDVPKHWKRPRRVFVCSMSDLFHPDVPDSFVDDVMRVVRATPQHTYFVLTKRSLRMMHYWRACWHHWLPQNVYVGVSVEDRQRQWRLFDLLQSPQPIKKFASFEPLLGELSLRAATLRSLSWAVVGCESGPKRRPCSLAWVRQLVEQLAGANVPVFVKQLDLNGRVERRLDKFPPDLRRCEEPREVKTLVRA